MTCIYDGINVLCLKSKQTNKKDREAGKKALKKECKQYALNEVQLMAHPLSNQVEVLHLEEIGKVCPNNKQLTCFGLFQQVFNFRNALLYSVMLRYLQKATNYTLDLSFASHIFCREQNLKKTKPPLSFPKTTPLDIQTTPPPTFLDK